MLSVRNLTGFQFSGSMITSLGASVIVLDTCFYENNFLPGASPIALFGNNSLSSFVGSKIFVDGNWSCDYVAYSEEPSAGRDVTCLQGTSSTDARICPSSLMNFSAPW